MWPAFLAADYYDSSAPSRQQRSATDLPERELTTRWRWGCGDGSHVHLDPFRGLGAQLCPCDLATVTPQAFTVASTAGDIDPPRSFPRVAARICVAAQPISVRLELVDSS